jgi:hypothetical protein
MTQPVDIEPTICPYCAAVLDAAVPSERGKHAPKPGMYCVCFACAALLRFTETLSLEKCDAARIPNIPPAVLAKVREVQAVLKEAEKKSMKGVRRELDRRFRR